MPKLREILALMVSDRVVATMIIINSLVLMSYGFHGFHFAYSNPLFALDYACTLYFVAEAAIKIHQKSWRGYWESYWNRFDFIVVAISLPMLLTLFLDTHDFGLILLLRLGRMFRLLRITRFIPDCDMLWGGIQRALKASIGVIITLFIYNFILGMIGSYLFIEVDPEHFGDPALAMYSVFKVFTVEGWYEIPDAIAAQNPMMAHLARGFFVFAVLSGGIIGLSIANAIFVDEMVLDNTRFLERRVESLNAGLMQEIAELKAMLRADRGDSG